MNHKTRAQHAAVRGLRYIPLNKPFKGCEGHHINDKHVIFIEASLHHMPHNQKTGAGMQKMNRRAFKALFKKKEHLTVPLKQVQSIMKKTVNNCTGIL